MTEQITDAVVLRLTEEYVAAAAQALKEGQFDQAFWRLTTAADWVRGMLEPPNPYTSTALRPGLERTQCDPATDAGDDHG